MKFAVGGPHLDREVRQAPQKPAPAPRSWRPRGRHLLFEPEGEATRDLFERVEVVGESDVRQRGHHVRVRDGVAEAQARHRPGLGEGAHDDQAWLGLEPIRAPTRARTARRPRRRRGCQATRASTARTLSVVSTPPVGLLGEQRKVTAGTAGPCSGRGPEGPGAPRRERPRSASSRRPDDQRRAGEAGDMGVQGVRRLEDHGRAAGPAVGEEEALDHFVGAVGAEDLGRVDAVVGAERRPKRGRLPIGVAVEGDGAQLFGQRLDEGGRWRLGRLVGVQPDLDLDLRRVVPGLQRDSRRRPPGGGPSRLTGDSRAGCGRDREHRHRARVGGEAFGAWRWRRRAAPRGRVPRRRRR